MLSKCKHVCIEVHTITLHGLVNTFINEHFKDNNFN